MSVNYQISDLFDYAYSGTVSTTAMSANANTGILYRDAADNDTVKILASSASTGQVLTTTGANTIGWQAPAATAANTEFLAIPAAAQTINSTGITNYTEVVWGTETIDTGTNFAANRYTLPNTGIYYFSTTIEWSTVNKSNKGTRRVEIVEDPAGLTPVVLQRCDQPPVSNKNLAHYQVCSIMYSGTAAELVAVRVSHSAGAADDQDVGVNSHFMGFQLS